jgi:hypothetical protein
MNVRPEPPDDQRCQFLWKDGKQCRGYREPGADHGFCRFHYNRVLREAAPPEPLPEWVAEEILPADGKLDSAAAINDVLTRVFRCVCEGRLTPRHAASLGYLGQLIIATLPGLERAAANRPEHPLLGRDPDAALANLIHALSASLPQPDPPTTPPGPPSPEAPSTTDVAEAADSHDGEQHAA